MMFYDKSGVNRMSIHFEVRQCSVCGGPLEYCQEKRTWKCPFCGAENVSTKQNSALSSIQNAVKQTILETAHRRFDSAAKCLIECERQDPRYVGTLIARITYQMISITTPGACDDRTARNHYDRMKKNYQQLRGSSMVMSAEERELYDFFEDADVYGVLVLVYDSLKDTARRDHVLGLLDAGAIYACPTNNSLLAYALKNSMLALADKVLENVNNLDTRFALNEVLDKYPDGIDKTKHIARLMKSGSKVHASSADLESYLSSSADSLGSKVETVIHAIDSGSDYTLESAMETLIPTADPAQTRAIIAAFCRKKLPDTDVARILEYACSCTNADTAVAMLECLQEGKQYVPITGKLLIAVLSVKELDADGKLRVLAKLLQFQADAKSIDAALNHYLCYNTDSPQTRARVIPVLLERVNAVPTNTVQNYILKCAADGASKPEVVEQLFRKGLNINFFQDLLSKYMSGSPDSVLVRAAIIDYLCDQGLKVSGDTLTDYICQSQDTVSAKIEFIRKLLDNGTQPGRDSANAYLEQTEPAQFSPELLTLLLTPASSFSARSVERYLLYIRDKAEVKFQTFRTIAQRCSESVESISCLISHGGNSVSCNLVQAYILLSKDPVEVTAQIVSWLTQQQRLRINAEMAVAGAGMRMRKYVRINRGLLSDTANAICEQFKVQTMLF